MASHAAPYDVVSCTIYNLDSKIMMRVPGGLCVFLDDGSYVTSDDSTFSLARVDPIGRVLWRQKLQVHHQLNLDNKKENLLLLTSSIHKSHGKRVRYDRIEARDLNGKLIKHFDFFDHVDELIKIAGVPKTFDNPVDAPHHGLPHHEFSHANSIYEIAGNTSANPAFQAGNYIVNANSLNLILILDREMKKVLYSVKHQSHPLFHWGYHDVQVTPQGKILIYNNSWLDVKDPKTAKSAIEEYDPADGSRKVIYRADPSQHFSSETFGGVQVLPGKNLLLSEMSNGGRAFEVDPNGKQVWESRPTPINPETGKHFPFQQIKRLELTEFLRKNTGI